MGKINPAPAPVLSHIPQDVGELVGDAQGHRRFTCIRLLTPRRGGVSRIHPHDLLGHQAHRAGYTEAVLVKRTEIGITVLGQVHPLAFDHLDVGHQRLGVALQHISHDPVQTIAHRAVEQLTGAGLPEIQPLAQLTDRQRLSLGAVHQLIGAATPDINGPDGPPLGGRHEQSA